MARKDETFEKELGRGYAYMTDEEIGRDIERRIQEAKKAEERRKQRGTR